jgi:hypothetical protein
LQPGRQVRGLADDRLFLGRADADQVADDHEPGGDTDAQPQLLVRRSDVVDWREQRQSSAHRSLGVVLVGAWIAEINQHAVAHVLRDKAIEPGDDLGDGAVIGADDFAQILGVEPRREPRRPHKIAEHNRKLTALCVDVPGSGGNRRRTRP